MKGNYAERALKLFEAHEQEERRKREEEQQKELLRIKDELVQHVNEFLDNIMKRKDFDWKFDEFRTICRISCAREDLAFACHELGFTFRKSDLSIDLLVPKVENEAEMTWAQRRLIEYAECKEQYKKQEELSAENDLELVFTLMEDGIKVPDIHKREDGIYYDIPVKVDELRSPFYYSKLKEKLKENNCEGIQFSTERWIIKVAF